MSERRHEGDPSAVASVAIPVVLPAAALPDVIRCLVCERPLLRARRETVRRSVMVQCPHCHALQHRLL